MSTVYINQQLNYFLVLILYTYCIFGHDVDMCSIVV